MTQQGEDESSALQQQLAGCQAELQETRVALQSCQTRLEAAQRHIADLQQQSRQLVDEVSRHQQEARQARQVQASLAQEHRAAATQAAAARGKAEQSLRQELVQQQAAHQADLERLRWVGFSGGQGLGKVTPGHAIQCLAPMRALALLRLSHASMDALGKQPCALVVNLQAHMWHAVSISIWLPVQG